MTFLKRLGRAFVVVASFFFKSLVVVGLLGATGALSGFVTMKYVITGEEVVVPNVLGLGRIQAEQVMRDSGLFLVDRNTRFDESAPENAVLEQSPLPGHRLKIHKRVWVIVSRGSRRLTVPDMVGLTLPQASVKLTEEGLELGRVVRAKSNHVVEGAVTAHEPPAGSEYFRDSAITLLVSAGPEPVAFVMPDLIGRNVDDVVKFMQDAGLRLGDIHEEEYRGLDPGTITRQQPRAGSRVGERDIITLTVVRGAFPDLEDLPEMGDFLEVNPT